MNRLPPTLRLVGIGWYIGLCIVLGLVGGLWLDRMLGLSPLLTLLGLLLGLLAAFWGGYLLLVEALGRPPRRGRVT